MGRAFLFGSYVWHQISLLFRRFGVTFLFLTFLSDDRKLIRLATVHIEQTH
jgi:hypothetical protein